MNEKTYKILVIAITLLSAVVVFFSVISNNYILPALAVITAFLSAYILKKQFKEVITEDERVELLSMRSSKISYVIFNIAAAIAGNALIIFSKNGPVSYAIVGYTLVFSVCFMLVIDVIAYFWLNRVG
jgi:uncharacterized membrane protein